MIRKTDPGIIVGFLVALIFLSASQGLIGADKIKLEDLVKLHKASIGDATILKERWGTAGSAVAKVEMLVGGGGNLEGPALYSSQDGKDMLFINFAQASYNREHLVYNGKDVQVAFMQPGRRSYLGEFIFTYKHLMKDGLLGSILSSRWLLFDEEFAGGKLKYSGVKKVDGVKLHKLEFRPKGPKDVQIAFFFDLENYRHVRSEYEVTIAPRMGQNPAESSRQRRTRQKVVENFGNFKEVDGLMLPSTWVIHYSYSGTNSSIVWKWTVAFDKMAVNQEVDKAYFNIVTNK